MRQDFAPAGFSAALDVGFRLAEHKDRHYCCLAPAEPFVSVAEAIVVTLQRLERS